MSGGRRTFLEFDPTLNSFDNRCHVCKNHQFLIQDCFLNYVLHSYGSLTFGNVAEHMGIHSWKLLDKPPQCRIYYKEIA